MMSDLFGGTDATQREEVTLRVVPQLLVEQSGSLRLTLCTHDGLLLILDGLLNEVLGTSGLLLGDLLCFDGSSVLAGKGKIRDGHIVQNDVELGSTLRELGLDHLTDLLTLCNQLGGCELCHDTGHGLVGNRWQNSISVVCAQSLNHFRQRGNHWLVQQTQLELHNLEIFASGARGDNARLHTDVERDIPLDTRQQKVSSFSEHVILDSAEFGEHNTAMTTGHGEEALVGSIAQKTEACNHTAHTTTGTTRNTFLYLLGDLLAGFLCVTHSEKCAAI
mmetsp:Transcript_8056/g.20332  ORF Transcript_8056/g.20332 Transcript_8056/m.20332 type:complete len:277 (+) Transcript_8056:192-1022(+)